MARKQGPGRSQALWTEAEALDRAGDADGAVKLFVQAALSEEQSGEPLRARLLWERLAARGPVVGGPLLERLATCSQQVELWDDAQDYWQAAALRYGQAGRAEDARRAEEARAELAPKVEAHAVHPIAAAVLAV